MMFKKTVAFTLLLLIVFSGMLVFSAATEVDEDARHYCICGRPYYEQTTDEHDKYECINCGKNRSNCVCNCWCGSETVISTEITVNGAPAHVCKRCGQLCAHCTCGDRDAVLALEEHIRNGEVFAGKVAKPKTLITTLVALIAVTVCVIAYALFYIAEKNRRTKAEILEKKATAHKHRKILEKIDEQASYKATAPTQARLAAEKAVVWNTDLLAPASIATELVNAVHFGSTDIPDRLAFIRYIADYVVDEDSVGQAAENGEYGSVSQTVEIVQKKLENGAVEQEILDYFENDFFYNSEKSIHKILGDYGLGSVQAQNVLYLPCSNEVRFGGSVATAEHWSEEMRSVSTDSSIPGCPRFTENYNPGGEQK